MRQLALPLIFARAAHGVARPALRRAMASAGLAALLCLTVYASASAHASLQLSDPEPNAVISEAPDAVTMRFTEPLERGAISARLFDQRGEEVPGTEARAGSSEYEMVLELPPDLPDGTYSVFWRTLSTADGHPAQNYFAFTVGTESEVATASMPRGEQPGDGPPQWAVTGSRWAALVGLAALVAAWPVWVGIVRPSVYRLSRSGPRITQLLRRFALAAAVAAGVGSLIALIVQAMTLPGGTLLDQMLETLEQTRYGRLWMIRIGLIVVLGMVLAACDWRAPQRRPLPAGAAVLVGLALPVPFSLMSHASAQSTGRAVAVAADVLHLLAASLWGGGLIVFAVVFLPALSRVAPTHRRAVLTVSISRFSALALVSWAIMGLTGFYAGWLQIGTWDVLRSTAYGQALLIKLALLGGVLTLAAVNLLVLQRRLARSPVARTPVWSARLRWTVGVEAALLLGMLLAVGQMTSLEPARDAVAQQRGSLPVGFVLNGGEAQLRLTPGTAGFNDFHLKVADSLTNSETRPVLMVLLPDREEMNIKEIHFTRLPDGSYTHRGSEIAMSGEWSLELVLHEQGTTPVSARIDQVIGYAGADSSRSGEPWRFAPVEGLAGLLIMLMGLGGSIMAIVAENRRLRRICGAVGLAGLVLGAALLAQARIEPGSGTPGVAASDPNTAALAEPGEPIPNLPGHSHGHR